MPLPNRNYANASVNAARRGVCAPITGENYSRGSQGVKNSLLPGISVRRPVSRRDPAAGSRGGTTAGREKATRANALLIPRGPSVSIAVGSNGVGSLSSRKGKRKEPVMRRDDGGRECRGCARMNRRGFMGCAGAVAAATQLGIWNVASSLLPRPGNRPRPPCRSPT